MSSQMNDGNYNYPYNGREIELSGYSSLRQEPNISISAVISASCSVIVDDPSHYLSNSAAAEMSVPHYANSDVVNCCEGQEHGFYDQNTDPRMQMYNYNELPYAMPENKACIDEYPMPPNDQYAINNSHVDNNSQSDFAGSSVSEDYAGVDIPNEASTAASLVEINVDEMLSNGVTVAGYKPRRMIQKRKKTKTPNENRTHGYWDKRRKNNDSARRSREAKKEKERNFYKRALELEYENFQLKEKISYLEEQLLTYNRYNGGSEPCG